MFFSLFLFVFIVVISRFGLQNYAILFKYASFIQFFND